MQADRILWQQINICQIAYRSALEASRSCDRKRRSLIRALESASGSPGGSGTPDSSGSMRNNAAKACAAVRRTAEWGSLIRPSSGTTCLNHKKAKQFREKPKVPRGCEAYDFLDTVFLTRKTEYGRTESPIPPISR